MVHSFIRRKTCPGCASPEANIVFSGCFSARPVANIIADYYRQDPASFGDATFDARECGRCGTIYQGEVGDDALLATLYGDWLATDGVTDFAAIEWLADKPKESRDGHDIMTAAAMIGRPLAGLRTLDYGMGMGLWARIARNLGCDSHGFDLAADRNANAAGHGVRIVAGDQIAEGAFDLINMEQTMEHVTDTDAVMAACVAGLAPGGLMRIAVPGQGSVRTALQALTRGDVPDFASLMPLQPLEHVNAFTFDGLARLGRRHGLTVRQPGGGERLAFLRHPGSLMPHRFRNFLKEAARPFLPLAGERNLIVWFARPA